MHRKQQPQTSAPQEATTNKCTTSSNHKQVHHKQQPQTSAPQAATTNRCTTNSNHTQVYHKQQPQTGASAPHAATTNICTRNSYNEKVQLEEQPCRSTLKTVANDCQHREEETHWYESFICVVSILVRISFHFGRKYLYQPIRIQASRESWI